MLDPLVDYRVGPPPKPREGELWIPIAVADEDGTRLEGTYDTHYGTRVYWRRPSDRTWVSAG